MSNLGWFRGIYTLIVMTLMPYQIGQKHLSVSVSSGSLMVSSRLINMKLVSSCPYSFIHLMSAYSLTNAFMELVKIKNADY